MTEYEDYLCGDYYSNIDIPHLNAQELNANYGSGYDYPNEPAEFSFDEKPKPEWGLTRKQREKISEFKAEGDGDGIEKGEIPLDGVESSLNPEIYADKDWPPEKQVGSPLKPQSEFFNRHETLRDRYNEVEIDSFLKLLNVKPYTNWQDQSVYHHSMGAKTFEDESQMTDPDYFLSAEVERQYLEKLETKKFRKGAVVRFNVGDKQPVFPHHCI